MKKRICGTCAYFQEGEIAGTGWCTHPQRQISADLKIMVRRGELACRDSWSRDLWVPKDETESDVAADLMSGRVLPMTTEEMTGLISKGQIEMSSSGKTTDKTPVDVVVGETPVPTEVDNRATLLTHEPRAAIELARQRRLERSGHAGLTQTPQTFAHSSTPTLSEQTVPPVQRDEIPRHFSGMARFSDDEDQFSTIPEIKEGIDLPRPVVPNTANLRAGEFGENEPESEQMFEEEFDEFPDETIPPPVQAERQHTPPPERSHRRGLMAPFVPKFRDPGISSDELIAQRRQRFGGLQIGGQNRVQQTASSMDANWHKHEHEIEPQRDHQQQSDIAPEWYPQEDKFDEPQIDLQDVVEPEHVIEPDWRTSDWENPPVHTYEYGDDEFDDSYGDTRGSGLLPTENTLGDRDDHQVHIAPDIPRMCRTCRDFRPADDNGDRGWCNNKWAFTHRRMVDADDLPCESSLGCWWLPRDDIWLANADAARHSRATPLVDLWLSRSGDRITASGGDGRRR